MVLVQLLADSEAARITLLGLTEDSELSAAALRRSTLLLEASQATAKVGGWELDLGTGRLFWKAETYRLHDTSPEEFNPTVDAGVGYFLPESRRIISAALQAAMERGEGYDLVLETLTTKGRRIAVRTTCAVTLHQGRPAKLTGIFQDITARTVAEAALRLSEERSRLASLAMHDVIWDWDLSGDTIAWNEQFEIVFGRPVDGVEPGIVLWTSRIHPDDAARVSTGIREARAGTGETWSDAYRFRRADGTYVEVMDRGHIVRDAARRGVRMVGAMQDISSRRRAEKERDRLFNFSVDMLCVAGFDGYFKQLNPAWERTLGWSNAELLSRPWLDRVHPDDRAATIAVGATLVDGGPIFQFENRFRHKDGSYHWLSWSSVPDREAKEIFSVARDITESKAAEDQLHLLEASVAQLNEAVMITEAISDDMDALLDSVRPDFVDICTAVETHLSLARVAAARGLPILCQKPLAPHVEQSEELAAACEAHAVRLMANDNWRWQGWYRELKRLIAAGAIGAPQHARFVLRPGDGAGDAPYPLQPFFREMERFLMLEVGGHYLDTMRFLLGDIAAVHCIVRRRNPRIRGEDAALVAVELSGGVTAILDADRTACTAAVRPPVNGHVFIEGSEGNLRLDEAGAIFRARRGEGEQEHAYCVPPGYRGGSAIAAQTHFIACLRSGAAFETEGRDYLAVERAVEACYRSAQQRTVERFA